MPHPSLMTELLAWARQWARHPCRVFWILDVTTLEWRQV